MDRATPNVTVKMAEPTDMETTSDTPTSKPGAPAGNGNNLRHGLRSLTIGNLPKGCGWIKSLVTQSRKMLEAAVIVEKGKVSTYDACVLQSAARWEQHGLLAQRWLRMNGDTMSDADRLTYSREIARASTERDKCLRSLGLDRDRTANAISAYFYKGGEL